jgi:hypothetical protein
VHSRIEDSMSCIYSANYLTIIAGMGARGSLVVKALCYKPEGSGFETR